MRHGTETLEQVAQQPRQHAVRHARVTGVGAVQRGLVLGCGEIAGEPALAHARLAEQQHRLPTLPRSFDRPPLDLAPDQAGRPQCGDRARRGDWWRQGTAALDQRREFAGFRARAGSELLGQHCAAALERGQCGGPITAPVVQPHHAPVCVFGAWRFEGQALGEGQRLGDAALGFELRRMLGQLLAPLAGPTLAGGRDPLGEFAAVVVVQRTEQCFRADLDRVVEFGRFRFQVVMHAVGQRHYRVRHHDLAAGALLQPEQPLAQIGLRGGSRQIGPQQAHDAAARGRPAQRQPCQQCRVAAFQHMRLALRQDQPRHAQQFDARCRRHGL